MSADAVDQRILFDNGRLRLGAFHCAPESPRWRSVNEIPPRPHVAFARTSVVIRHLGREPVLANRNHAIFYNAGERFHRRLHDDAGDRSYFVELEPETVAEATGGESEFPFTHGPTEARVELLLHAAVRHAVGGRTDALLVEESLVRALSGAVASARAVHRVPRSGRRETTDREHTALVEAAKDVLSRDLAAPLSLREVARRVHCSEFHLARVFRVRTGFTVHAYRTHLRLREALARLDDAETTLTRLALELGFASHSHLTDAFRTAFGTPPSAVRNRRAAARLPHRAAASQPAIT